MPEVTEQDLQSPIVRVGLTVLAIILVVVAPIVAFSAWSRLSEARAAKSWPTAEAKVLRCELVESSQGSYSCELEYEFEVDGKTYKSDRITAWDRGSSDRSGIEEQATKYAADTTHPASYNPDDPSQSYLEPGPNFVSYLMFLIPIVMLALAGGCFWMVLKKND